MPELNWMGDAAARRAAQRVPYRLLQVEQTVGEGVDGLPPENLLVQGDNLEALKSLLPLYAGRVKCIFIDPPYNTKTAFEHYDDNLEHSQWLSMMYPRLVLLRELLSEDGSIYVAIDYNEAHYLKVLMDEVFGRKNFQREIIWRIGWLSGYKTIAKNYIRNHDTILYYSKNAERTYFKKVYLERKDFQDRFSDNAYKALLKRLEDLGVSRDAASDFMRAAAEEGLPDRYPLEDTWNSSIYDKLNSIAVVSFSGESVSKMLGVAELKGQKSEALIRRVLLSSTEPGDLVLDSFAGTGTTGAVAHKMNRRWIMVEIGDHARTHIVPRLEKVIRGEDQSGISRTEGWQGGGGFRFATLGEPVFDADGQINPAVRFAPLAAYVWREQTHTPHPTGVFDSPLLGVHGDTAFALLYNGILGDRRPEAGNVLTLPVWRELRALAPDHAGPWRIFGEACRLPPALMREHGIVFRQIPYQLGAG